MLFDYNLYHKQLRLAASLPSNHGDQMMAPIWRNFWKSTVCLIALLLPLGSSSQAADDIPAQCQNKLFDLAIVEADHDTKAIVSLHLGELGEQRAVLDTGMGLNGVLIAEPDASPGTTQWHDFKIVNVAETKQALHLFRLSVSVDTADRVYATTGARYILNPKTLTQSGFTVMDIKHKHLVGFATESDLRKCYGHGAKSTVFPNEASTGDVDIDAVIDGHVEGRVSIDTGAYLTEFYSEKLRQDDIEPAPELAYYRLNGERVVPALSHHHSLRIGNMTHDLPIVTVPSGPGAITRAYPAGRIGYASLKQSILIFPPEGLEYWELIF
jgi:hypothetical protein